MTGDYLRFRRKALGLSQAQLALRLDIPRNTIARWERGEMRIEHGEVLNLALRELAHEQRGR